MKKEMSCINCGQPGLINPDIMLCDTCYFAIQETKKKDE